VRSDAGEQAESPATGTGPNGGPSAPDDGGSDTDPNGFGARGWVLVGAVVLSTAVIPGVIYAAPALPAEAGLPFLVAMLVLPLVPAVLLGVVAVWSLSAATPGDRN